MTGVMPEETERLRQGLACRLMPGLLYGGDYNPEQWPESSWPEDARLMREAGVNLVTVGVFAWAMLEPSLGERDFGWLDRVLDLLGGHGIRVDLATATASPPPWMASRFPESLPVDADGHRLWHGARQQFCPSSTVYRERAVALVEDLAGRYAGHPALTMWHVGNEYGAHVAACWCDACGERFRAWLQRRYGDLDALNHAWGTAFWSQRYGDWTEVIPPRRTPYVPNPTQQLDFCRFSSDNLLECFKAERDVLVRLSPGVPVTTNFMGLFKPLDYWRWAEAEDLVSSDWYPDPEDPDSHLLGALGFDLMRSLGGGRPWLLMEQAASAINWRARNRPKRPGQMRLWSLQAVARGADGVCFFQWRASKAGAEKFHSGMVPHAGPDTRVFREVSDFGAELSRLVPVAGSRVPAQAALVLDWPSWWASELDSHPSADFRLQDALLAHYGPLWRAGVATDLVRPDADLGAYRLVVVPNLYLVGDAAVERLNSFVAGGGTLVMSFFSGIVDEHDHVRLGGYPAPFRELLGLTVEEFWPLLAAETLQVRSAAFGSFTGMLWAEAVRADGAEVLAEVDGGDLDGTPLVLRHSYGRGVGWYVATRPEPAAMASILGRAYAEAGVHPTAAVTPGVEVVRRVGDGASYLFLLNHGDRPVETTIPHSGVDLLTGRRHQGTVALDQFGVAVIAEERS
jgi:beta-galactosidase